MSPNPPGRSAWPELRFAEWRDSGATLQLWTQIVGKLRLALSPWLNHGWQVPLYVSARGLGSSAMHVGGGRLVEVEFDLVDHRLVIRSSDAAEHGFALAPMSVAAFYRRFMAEIAAIGIHVAINVRPNEVADPIPFPDDETHAAYDPAAVHTVWRALVQADRVFRHFRSGFLGKASPVHLFWGAFDLAVTRFSGKRAPERPEADGMTREAYSHEVISHGFWPGSGPVQEAAFYAYSAPPPDGLAQAKVEPAAAGWSTELGEFILPYEAVRQSGDPEAALTAFLETTYDAGARLAGWNRDELERR